MNEYFGKNIRKLRKNKNLTQEKFAEALGVSFQSVSRWENCITYPDVELIPMIARYFSVKIDELFGIPEENKKAEFKALMKELTELGEDDTERAIEIMRAVRAGYDLNNTFGDLCNNLRYSQVKKTATLTDELRRMSEAFFECNPDANTKTIALQNFVQLEEEQYIPALLDRYASSEDATRDSLLYERYLYRDEFDKLEVCRQRKNYRMIDELINGNISWKDWRAPNDVHFAFWKNNLLLDFLHGLNNETPTAEHPISCGKGPDIFLDQRVLLGELRTCYLATLGKTEEAYQTLEDTVSLMEQAYALPNGAMLKSNTRALPTLELKVDRRKTALYYTFNGGGSELCDMWGITPEIDYERLTSKPGWAWLNPIRGDERFKALAERVKRLTL